MLHVRVVAPSNICDNAVEAIEGDPTVVHFVRIERVTLDQKGDLILFDVARENADAIVERLRALGVVDRGSLSLSDPATVLSRAAENAERVASGHPSDAVIWDEIGTQAREDSRLSGSFLAFLTLATIIAGIGRYLDQPILIIGAMVVGPEFAPLAAICLGIAQRQWSLIAPAASTLIMGFAFATLVAGICWAASYQFGLVDFVAATTGKATQFIIEPDGWSFLIAILAGCAGVLSLTSAKSSALVGVFISITTVPAAGTIALTLAVGAWEEAVASLIQLIVNIAGITLAGSATLAAQRLIWSRRKFLDSDLAGHGRVKGRLTVR